MKCFFLLFAGAVLLFASTSAIAAVSRFATLIGNNRGLHEEVELRYAEQDAKRLATILKDLGEVPPSQLDMLIDQDLASIQKAMADMEARIQIEQKSGIEVLWFFYYSGHASADGLHINGKILPLEQLRSKARLSKAKLRVLVVDACRSGALTRVKGGAKGPAFPIAISKNIPGEGVVYVTSTAVSEEAQETDVIKGSFFSHYWASALLGAADTSGDGQVTLSEAYRYAYERTMAATIGTAAGVQHPTFEYDLRGKGDVLLTRVGEQKNSRGTLSLPAGGGTCLLLREGPKGDVVAELGGPEPTRITVPPGNYFVRWRMPDYLLEGPVRVRVGEKTRVEELNLQRVAYARLVRKGLPGTFFAQSVAIHAEYRSEILSGLGPMVTFGPSWQLDLPWITLQIRALFGERTATGEILHIKQREIGSDLHASVAFDIWQLSIGAGLSLGFRRLRQDFSWKEGVPHYELLKSLGLYEAIPKRNSWAFVAGLGAYVSTHIWKHFFVTLEGGGAAYVLPAANYPGNKKTVTPLVPRFGIGLGAFL